MLPRRLLLALILTAMAGPRAHATQLVGIDTFEGVYQIDGTTGDPSLLGTLAGANFGSFFLGIDFDRTGQLVGYMIDGRVYRIDPSALTAELVFDTGVPLSEGDISFHPTTDNLYVIGGTTLTLLEIDLQAKTVENSILLPFGLAELNPGGLAFDPSGSLFVQDNKNDQFLQLDPATGQVLSSAVFSFPPPPFGVGLGGPLGGLDYDPESGEFFARSGASLFRGDPATGSFVPVSLFPANPIVMGAVAVATVPEAGALLLLVLGGVAMRSRKWMRRPAA